MNVVNTIGQVEANPSIIVEKARVLVVEDHPIVREGLARLLDRQADMVCCGQVDSVMAAPGAVRELGPDLVLLDLAFKDGDGFDLLSELVAQFQGLRVLVLSQHDEDTHAETALRHGAQGYVMKQEATREVLTAIRTVLAGEIYLSQHMAAQLIRKFTTPRSAIQPRPFGNLTGREQEVLQLLGGGLSTREIAHELKLSVKTIETYREHLKSKLGLANGTQLTEYALRRVQNPSATPPPRSGTASHG